MTDPSLPAHGCTIAFSAGSRYSDTAKRRVVSGNASTKLSGLLLHFPVVHAWFASSPLLLQAYPATLPPPRGVVFVDSYGRWQTFATALSLAAEKQLPCIITAMPLTAAHLLLSALHAKTKMPSKILLLLGGYYCPSTLESFLVDLMRKAGASATVLHLYGVGEIDAGLLAGQRKEPGGEILFRSIDAQWHCFVRNGFLSFQDRGDHQTIIATDDMGETVDEGIRLLIPSRRIDREIYEHLERWTPADWCRRTGYLHYEGGFLKIQCRPDIVPDHARHECEHYDFCRRFAQSWLDKPNWCQQAQETNLALPSAALAAHRKF